MAATILRKSGLALRAGVAAGLIAIAGLSGTASADETAKTGAQATAEADSTWSGLKYDLFGDRELVEGTDAVGLDAPSRAADPALVPMTISLDPDKDIRKVTLVIDENPSPVAATFDIAEDAGLTSLSTRVRVNAYTDVHVVAEGADGTLYVTKAYVKAAGGCAAPAAKDPELAAREMGKMKLRDLGALEGLARLREAQLQIRHPNNSGLQKDQVTLLYIPAHFVDEIEVDRGGKPLFTMTGGISISEDPNFRFTYTGEAAESFHVRATDTDGNVFEKTFDQTPA